MGPKIDNTVIVIPAYNEARTIGSIARDLVGTGFSVLVVDDGSQDGTEREALDNGAMVIRNKTNLGKGLSVREGAKYVIDKTNFKWIVLMDGDGQHHPEDIPSLMNAAHAGDVDIVIGNRMDETKSMPSVRYWTNRFTSFVTSRLCGQRIPDSQCGFRLVSVSAVKKMELMTDRYDIESEMLIEAARHRMKILSVPVKTIYGDEVSQVHPVHDTIRFFGLIFRHYFGEDGIRRRTKKNG
jgi:glycosyltransferase involved in cell wall biosynthesis